MAQHAHAEVPWRSMRNMRNRMAHGYFDINLDVMWETLQKSLKERDLTVEPTRAGLEVAKQLGRKGGRRPNMTDNEIASAKKLLAGGVPPRDVAKSLGVSIPTPYRWVPASAHA